jgi:hypothetical protein
MKPHINGYLPSASSHKQQTITLFESSVTSGCAAGEKYQLLPDLAQRAA